MISGHSRSTTDRQTLVTSTDLPAPRARWAITDLPSWLCGLHLLRRAVLLHHPVKDGLLNGKAALLPKSLLGYSLVMLSPPSRIAFRVGGVCLFNGGEQPSCSPLALVPRSFHLYLT